jgi:hypothetical protein
VLETLRSLGKGLEKRATSFGKGHDGTVERATTNATDMQEQPHRQVDTRAVVRRALVRAMYASCDLAALRAACASSTGTSAAGDAVGCNLDLRNLESVEERR